MTAQRKTQLVITICALALLAVHILWPDFSIDAISLIFLAAAAIPWLLPLFKSVELPGGVKLEFQDLQATEQRAAAAGLLDEPADLAPPHEYSFQVVADEDANLALAGLRIEIERRLRLLAHRAGIGDKRKSTALLLRFLGEKAILTPEQRNVLQDLVRLLNSAAHGATVAQQSAQWALDIGPKLLTTLDKRIEHQHPC